MLKYIPNEYGRDWMSRDRHDGVYLLKAYIHINEGNLYDAVLFSQIMYWHRPNMKTGEQKLTQPRDGFYWLAKNHGDWYTECGINKNTARKILKRLEARNLIIVELHGFNGVPTPWIRVNWDGFERRTRAYEAGIDMKTMESDLADHTPCDNGSEDCPDGSHLLTQQVKSNTETTTETTQQTTTKNKRNNQRDFF